MSLRNTLTTYGCVAKFFHWLIFVLVIGMLTFGYFMDDLPKAYQGMGYNLHKLTGLSILCLMILRALWAMINPKPILSADVPLWQRWLERAVHFLIYAALIAMPLAGWIETSAGGKPPHLGNWQLGLPIAKNENLSDFAYSVHNSLAIVIIVLISIHVLAALYHYFIKKDDILQRML